MIAAPTVTIVLATYGRPDTLRHAIESVRLQSWPRWHLLVIGDHCDSATAALVNAFDDPRIEFVNLPARAGEQSGPNSVGMALASTEYLAFLNHDDLWLNDHLEYGLNALADSNADFFVGATAFAFSSESTGSGEIRPVFDRMHRAGRHPKQCISPVTRNDYLAFEPASAWLLRTASARRVGNWRGREAFVGLFPLQDWVRRAWKQGLRFELGDRLTVLKITTQYRRPHPPAAGAYAAGSDEYTYVSRLLEQESPAALREMILAQVAARRSGRAGRWFRSRLTPLRERPVAGLARLGLRAAQKSLYALLSPVTRWTYSHYDVDLRNVVLRSVSRALGNDADQRLSRVVRQRTGERFVREHDIDTIVRMSLAAHRPFLPGGEDASFPHTTDTG